MAVQIQSLVSDASRLSQLFRDQAERLKQINLLVVFAVIGIFCAYFLVSYLMIQRRTLKSIAILQAGAAVIGSGNREFVITETRDDEIGDLSRVCNRMTADLKAVTASKTDLEREMAERQKAEVALRRAHDEHEARVRERTAALSASVTRLELMNQEQREFAHVASHDLQDPLRKIQTFCDLAKRRCEPALDSPSAAK